MVWNQERQGSRYTFIQGQRQDGRQRRAPFSVRATLYTRTGRHYGDRTECQVSAKSDREADGYITRLRAAAAKAFTARITTSAYTFDLTLKTIIMDQNSTQHIARIAIVGFGEVGPVFCPGIDRRRS
jgi:hypothetical protein